MEEKIPNDKIIALQKEHLETVFNLKRVQFAADLFSQASQENRCAACRKIMSLDPPEHVVFSYFAFAYVENPELGRTVVADAALPQTSGGVAIYCFDCAAGGANPFVDAALLTQLVGASGSAGEGKLSLWQRIRGK